MIDVEKIKEAVLSYQSFTLIEDVLHIRTQCLYPSNTFVCVAVRGGPNSYVVSDNGGAVMEAVNAGLEVSAVDKGIANLVKGNGLKAKDGVIYSPEVPIEGIAAAVFLVANATREAAEWCFRRFGIKRTRKFKEMLAALLDKQFTDALKPTYPVVGASTKRYTFDYAVLSGDRTILIDAVVRDPNSIYSRFSANMDVREAKNPLIEQHVIYDDLDEWNPSDLALLGMAASIVPFSEAQAAIRRWGQMSV